MCNRPRPPPPLFLRCFVCVTRAKLQDREVAVVVSFLEIYCDRVRDLGEAYMSQGERAVHGLKTTSDVHQKMKLVRSVSGSVVHTVDLLCTRAIAG